MKTTNCTCQGYNLKYGHSKSCPVMRTNKKVGTIKQFAALLEKERIRQL